MKKWKKVVAAAAAVLAVWQVRRCLQGAAAVRLR